MIVIRTLGRIVKKNEEELKVQNDTNKKRANLQLSIAYGARLLLVKIRLVDDTTPMMTYLFLVSSFESVGVRSIRQYFL